MKTIMTKDSLKSIHTTTGTLEGARRATEGGPVVEARDAVTAPDPEVDSQKRRRKLTAQYKLRILQEADNCTDRRRLGMLLRREGLYSSSLTRWRRLRDQGVTSRIVMLTVSDSDEDVLNAISLGADGYLLKDMEPEDLLENILRALNGKMVLSEAVTQVLATAIRNPSVKTGAELDTLTQRELEILKLIAKGLSNKLIARELDISDGTVKVHVKHLLKKLHLRSRVEAAVWMINQDKN